MGLPLQGGILPQVGSYPKTIAILLWMGSLQISASPLGVPCPHKAKGVWAPMVLSGNFRKLPGPSRTIIGHSGMVLGCSETSGLLSEPFELFWDVLELSG